MRKRNGKKKTGKRKTGKTKSKSAASIHFFVFSLVSFGLPFFTEAGFRFITFRIMTNWQRVTNDKSSRD